MGTRRSSSPTSTVACFAPRSNNTRPASPAAARARASSVLPSRISVMMTAAVSK